MHDDDASPDEMRAMLHTPGAMQTLDSCLAYCRRMERENPNRAQAWRGQAHRFIQNNPTPRGLQPRPRKRRRI